MIDQKIVSQLENAIEEILIRGLDLSFHKWYSRPNGKNPPVWFCEGSGFVTKNSGGKIVSCDPLGALLVGAQKENTPLNNISYAAAARILGVNDEWVVAFGHGWDDANATREYWNAEAHDLGVQLRLKYHWIYEE